MDAIRWYRRRQRLLAAARDEAHFLRRRHQAAALQAAREKLARGDLSDWGRKVVRRAIKDLEHCPGGADPATPRAEAPVAGADPSVELLSSPRAQDLAAAAEQDAGARDKDAAGDPPKLDQSVIACGPSPAPLVELRQRARAEALGKDHRLDLATAAGPGSLAEALNALVAEGLVEAQFIDHDETPYLLYRRLR